jgi:N-methylhydantoinase A
MGWRVGIDTGGTFTDLVLFSEETGELASWKVASTPADPSLALATGIQEVLGRRGLPMEALTYLGHGTTVATNAFLEQKGARTGLLTTAGFRDLLELGRQARPHLYDLRADKHPVIVPGALRHEVRERLRSDGSAWRKLNEADVRRAARELAGAGVEAIAICFLFSFMNPAHEARAKRIVQRQLPGAYVSMSSEIIPEFREYERMATTVLNAYLGPVVARYMARLAERLTALGLRVVPQITQSNGGIMSVHAASTRALETAFSGPASGVMGAAYVGRLAGCPDLISIDMGGTSADVAVVEGGRPKMTTSSTIGPYPAKVPMVEVDTVGAGGGSLAVVDVGGALKVGPHSAGADPGPACYGRGGRRPTVTDAHVVLGRIGATGLLAGRMRLDVAAARRALAEIGERLSLSPVEAAHGVLRIVNANMLRLIRKLSVERGYDPRDYALVAFGGCGPLHAGDLAEELGTRTAIVPENAGVLSALGQLLADVRADFVRTAIQPVEPSRLPALEATYRELGARASAWLESEGVPPGRRRILRQADARYLGQNWELLIDLPAGPLRPASAGAIAEAFHAAHQRKYTYALRERTVELINCRVTALGEGPKPSLPEFPPAAEPVEAARIGARPVAWDGERLVETPVFLMDRLRPGHELRGPAIVEQFTATTALRPGDRARVDRYRNLIVTVRNGGGTWA